MSEERNVVLWCGVYDLATVFPVEIALSATVFSLKIDIATMVNHSPIFTRLYMARDTNGIYLKEDDDFKVMLHGPVQEHFAEMLPSWTLSDYFETSFTPQQREIHVLVKLVQTSPLTRAVQPEYELSINMDQEFLDAVRPYEVVANRLKDHPLVDKLVQELIRVAAHPVPSPTVVLESSLGTGKTQMAFNLAAQGHFEVFHVLCTQQGDISLSVYKAFLTRSESFRTCVVKDLACLDNGSPLTIVGVSQLHMFGFIAAALRGDTVVRGPSTRLQVMKEIQSRQERNGKPLAFFLDEFQSIESLLPLHTSKDIHDKRERDKYLRVMRNVFRACSLPVIVSSTSGSCTTSDLFVAGDVSCGGSPVPWCVVFPSLPSVSLSDECDKLSLPDQIQRILEHSRPIFVSMAREHVRTAPCSSSTNPLAYLNDMIDDFACQIGELKEHSANFIIGQCGLLLGTSFKHTNAIANIVEGHFARLDDTQPFQLDINLTGKLLKGIEIWHSRTELPPPTEDLLLHLVLTRDLLFQPNKPLYQVLLQQFGGALHQIPSMSKYAPGLLVGAAMVHASHYGDISGVSISTFFGVLLFELGVTKSKKELRLPVHENLIVPFLSPLNSRWPSWFHDDWKTMGARFDNFECTRAGDRTNFRTNSNLISGECTNVLGNIDAVRKILARIPAESAVHFVFSLSVEPSILRQFTGALPHADIFCISGHYTLQVEETHRSQPGMDKVTQVFFISLNSSEIFSGVMW